MSLGWLNVFLRAQRAGDDAEIKPSRGILRGTALLLTIRALTRANRAQPNLMLHESLVEVRGSLRESATDARDRDARAEARDQRLYRTTRALLVVALIALVVSIIALSRG